MRILLTGANGFIGKYLIAELLERGHDVVPAVRGPEATDRLLPEPTSIFADLNRDTSPDIWVPRLSGIDAVINCAGILQGTCGQSIKAIHVDGPRALFEACIRTGVRRVIQISAVSASRTADTAYAATKAEADDYLRTLDLDWTIFKPSLVVAPGAYGGTALLRALASLPWVVPTVGTGLQEFRPVEMRELCRLVADAVSDHSTSRQSLFIVGPDIVTLRGILTELREWLGYGPAHILEVPLWLVSAGAKVGDLLGGTINTTALRQLQFGNAARQAEKHERLRVIRTGWRKILHQNPAQAQDRWHARLHFLRPLLRAAVGSTWIASGLVGFLQPLALAQQITSRLGMSDFLAAYLATGASAADVLIGLAVLVRWRPRIMVLVQVLLVTVYTIGLSVAMPELWADAFGPLLKNIPFIVAILVLAAIESDR